MKVEAKLLEQIIAKEIFQLLLENRIEFIHQTYLKKLTKQLFWRWKNNKISYEELDALSKGPSDVINIPFSAVFSYNFDDQPVLEDFVDLALNLLNLFFETDTTSNKQNTQWMIKKFLQDEFRVEDIPALGATLEQFELLKRNKVISGVDINQLSLKQLRDLTRTNQDSTPLCRQDLTINSYIKSGEAELLLNTPEFKIIVPRTKEASCYFGKNTDWCTASSHEEHNMFFRYTSGYATEKGPSSLYIVVQCHGNNEEEYWQFHFETKQFMDKDDRPINLEKWLNVRPEIVDFFSKIKPPGWMEISVLFEKDKEILKLALQEALSKYEEFLNYIFSSYDGDFNRPPTEFLNRILKNKNFPKEMIYEFYEKNKLPDKRKKAPLGKQMWFLNEYFKIHKEKADPILVKKVFNDYYSTVEDLEYNVSFAENLHLQALKDNFFRNGSLTEDYIRRMLTEEYGWDTLYPRKIPGLVFRNLLQNPNLPADIVEEVLSQAPEGFEEQMDRKLPPYNEYDMIWKYLEALLLSAAPTTNSFKMFSFDKIRAMMLRDIFAANNARNLPKEFLEKVIETKPHLTRLVNFSKAELKRREKFGL